MFAVPLEWIFRVDFSEPPDQPRRVRAMWGAKERRTFLSAATSLKTRAALASGKDAGQGLDPPVLRDAGEESVSQVIFRHPRNAVARRRRCLRVCPYVLARSAAMVTATAGVVAG